MIRISLVIYTIIGLGILFFYFSGSSVDKAIDDNKIRFMSLAWQTQAIAANKRIVKEWNEMHPEMPVEYIAGSWTSMADYLATGFETGDLPDIFHYLCTGLVDFALRDHLADLSPYISQETREDIIDTAWDPVTRSNGEIMGIPFLIEPMINIYNKRLFEEAGIAAPTQDAPWSWDELRAAAKKLTKDTDGDGRIDQWGLGMALQGPSRKILELSPNFGGSFIYTENNQPVIRVKEAERALLKTLRDLLYEDRSLAPSSIGSNFLSVIPGFFQEKYAIMLMVGVWVRQQMSEHSPEGFRWGVFPGVKGVSQRVGTVTQTLSIPKMSNKTSQAMDFIEFFLNTGNMAELAVGDWEAPTRKSCFSLPVFQTTEDGWKQAIEAVENTEAMTWLGVPGYTEWQGRVANPILEEMFANRLTLDEACKKLETESAQILKRYRKRRQRW